MLQKSRKILVFVKDFRDQQAENSRVTVTLDPVCFGAVALHKSGVIIIPPTPKGGFKFKRTLLIYRNVLYNKLILYIIFSLTTIISQAFQKSKSVLFKFMCFVSVLFDYYALVLFIRLIYRLFQYCVCDCFLNVRVAILRLVCLPVGFACLFPLPYSSKNRDYVIHVV